ncbi:GSCFA domain-containing protein [Candidatus Ponderosibacter sp. Uisw_141_02]|uniref:GSCFA domain-containing protein n=1 Tax=Candidatus Ponderosibacter sp. Uisw_141_02 TaxID=3231000 RepID=UPI003D4DAC49
MEQIDEINNMHPYSFYPPENFWKTGVAELDWEELCLKSKSKFKLATSDKISTAGSCFAQHIASHLNAVGLNHYIEEKAPYFMTKQRLEELNYNVFSARYGNIYTVKQFRQLIEFAFNVRRRSTVFAKTDLGYFDLLRPLIQPQGFGTLHDLECDREYHLNCVRKVFEGASCFIFTLGLIEYWSDQNHDVAFPICPGTKIGVFDPSKHALNISSYTETVHDLYWCIDFCREVNPKMNWIFTVSPVALAATAQDQHVLLATSAAKSLLRAALEEVCGQNINCEYFPSFEITSHIASKGAYLSPDKRNIAMSGVAHAMKEFKATFMADDYHPVFEEPPAQHLVQNQIKQAATAECDESFNDPRIV